MRPFSSTEESLVVSYVPGHWLFGEIVGYSVYCSAAVSHSLPSTITLDMSMLDVMMLMDLVDAFTDKSTAVTAKALV
jgi:hypothetical protein